MSLRRNPTDSLRRSPARHSTSTSSRSRAVLTASLRRQAAAVGQFVKLPHHLLPGVALVDRERPESPHDGQDGVDPPRPTHLIGSRTGPTSPTCPACRHARGYAQPQYERPSRSAADRQSRCATTHHVNTVPPRQHSFWPLTRRRRGRTAHAADTHSLPAPAAGRRRSLCIIGCPREASQGMVATLYLLRRS